MKITLEYPDEFGTIMGMHIVQLVSAPISSPMNATKANTESCMSTATIPYPKDGDQYVLRYSLNPDKRAVIDGSNITSFNNISFEKKATADAEN